jgi:copper homeostasis protein CutC
VSEDDRLRSSAFSEILFGYAPDAIMIAFGAGIEQHPLGAIANEVAVTDFHGNTDDFWRDLHNLVHEACLGGELRFG